MNISSVTAALNMQKDVASSNVSASTADDFKSALTNALNNGEDKQLKEACDELEIYLLSMVFKQTKESMLSNDDDEDSLIPKGDYIEMFEENMINTLAEKVSEVGGIGISDMLYKQMKATYGAQMQVSENAQAAVATQLKVDDEI